MSPWRIGSDDAVEVSAFNFTRAFHSTNGRTLTKAGVYAAVRASISFNEDVCWIQDNTFCYGLNQMKGDVSCLRRAPRAVTILPLHVSITQPLDILRSVELHGG